MSLKLYIPRDAAAKALGADEVVAAVRAEAAKRGVDVTIVRNGSRGMVWLEPLVEVERADGRHAFGPVAASDVASLFDANWGPAMRWRRG
jgi:formate dehydrogenase iron-sulfur subunit